MLSAVVMSSDLPAWVECNLETNIVWGLTFKIVKGLICQMQEVGCCMKLFHAGPLQCMCHRVTYNCLNSQIHLHLVAFEVNMTFSKAIAEAKTMFPL